MASERAGEGPLRRDEIEAFAADWYHKLDEHVPAADIMPLVLDQGLEFVVPEATLRSRREFGDWYAGGGDHPGVINLFFDEVHTLSLVEASVGGTGCGGQGGRQLAGPALDSARPPQRVVRVRRLPDMANDPVAGNREAGDRPICGGRVTADAGLAAALMLT